MELLLSMIALTVILAAGFSISLLLSGPRRVTLVELASTSFLFGSAFVSIAFFCLGYAVSASALKWIIAALCIGLAVTCIATGRHKIVDTKFSLPKDIKTIALLIVLLCEVYIVFWLSLSYPLDWDGYFIWETKARLAYANGGAIPLDYFKDSFYFSIGAHPAYPLFLPMIEAWLYSWVGQDQGMVKGIFPLFYLAAVGLLYCGCSRYGLHRNTGLLTASLLFFVPQFIVGPGSIESGYADFPLATFYLASIVFLVEYIASKSRRALYLSAMMVGLTLWIKSEGIILWACVVAIVIMVAIHRRDWKAPFIALLPGALVFSAWQMFLKSVGNIPEILFLSITPANIWMNRDRILPLFTWTANELVHWKTWSLLWVMLALAIVCLGRRLRKPVYLVPFAAILIPIVLQTGTYILTNVDPYLLHVVGSMPRLMESPALVAILAVSLGFPRFKSDVVAN